LKKIKNQKAKGKNQKFSRAEAQRISKNLFGNNSLRLSGSAGEYNCRIERKENHAN
jgi:hypothetical protein